MRLCPVADIFVKSTSICRQLGEQKAAGADVESAHVPMCGVICSRKGQNAFLELWGHLKTVKKLVPLVHIQDLSCVYHF